MIYYINVYATVLEQYYGIPLVIKAEAIRHQKLVNFEGYARTIGRWKVTLK